MRAILRQRNPLLLAKMFWPGAGFYDKENEIITAVKEADEVIVPAGNMLGKDYTAGYIALSFFLFPQAYFDQDYVANIERQRKENYNPHTVRVITTSVDDDHLKVLWAEIGKFISTCRLPLIHPTSKSKSHIVLNHQEIRFGREAWTTRPLNYLLGRVGSKENEFKGLSGHHAAYTLAIIDEASGVNHLVYDRVGEWAKRILVIGNPNQCAESHFFKAGVKGGDMQTAGS